jgi:putative MATE family efflux protein
MSDHSEETPSGQSPAVANQTSGWRAVRAALAGERLDYTSGSIGRAVALLAIPMVIEMAGESIFAITDAFYVARVGSEALATVALTESMLAIVYSLAVGIAMATTAMVARRVGADNEREASHVAAQAIMLGVALSVVLGIAGMFLAPDLLAAMGAPPEIVEIGATYTRTMLGGMVTIMLLFIINSIFRGAGDASVAMKSLWLANAINIILDPCLIFGLGPFPELGLTGAAIATNIGRGCGVAYQLWSLAGRKVRLSPTLADALPDRLVLARLLKISWGGIGQNLIATASWIGLVRILAVFGPGVLAGYVIAIRIVVFAILPAWGISNAAATLVGQNLGAGKPDRAERSVLMTGWYAMAFLGLVTVVFVLAAEPLVSLFTTAGPVRETAAECLRIISYGYVFYAWGMVMVQAFNGAGDTGTPTMVNFVCFWLFQIPLAYLLSQYLDFGPAGVFWAIAASYSLSAVIGVVLFRRGSWKTKTA